MDREKRLIRLPVAREGFALIILSLALSVLLYIFDVAILSVFPFLFSLFCIFFFRNPKRAPLVTGSELISPADGKVLEIKDIEEDEFVGGISKRVSIFMSPMDVHVNRSPCKGRIVKVVHKPGEFALAFKKDIDKENERNYILIQKGEERVLLVQIAGFLARRIISYVKEGDLVERGDAVGMIAFGSRVDIYIPQIYEPMIQLNTKVKAGVTPLAKRREPE